MKYKEMQIRLTHADCINRQNELMELLEKKIQRNTCLNYDEREEFHDLLANALLSQGNKLHVNHIAPDGTVLPMDIVYTFALRLRNMKTNRVKLRMFNKIFIINISDLWETLYRYLLRLFPYALEEALHISREIPQKEETSSYIFSPDKKLQ